MRYEEVAPILAAIEASQGSDHAPRLSDLAADLGIDDDELRRRIDDLVARGLAVAADDQQEPPILVAAGQQYLARAGAFDRDVLTFLPDVIDDLHARRALLHGGSVLIDEFRAAILHGGMVDHARGLVPPAFEVAVDDAIALDLFAAAVALLARLSAGEPAGCVAEEILAVSLLENARDRLEIDEATGVLDADEARDATEALLGLFDLFEDDDVLRLFEMGEPGDAAVAGHSTMADEMGIVDQRIEAWLTPFGGVTRTGHLRESPGT